MNIDKFLKEGKRIIIELDDEVDYLLTDDSIKALRNDEGLIPVVRLIDKKQFGISIDRVEKALSDKENIDYINKES